MTWKPIAKRGFFIDIPVTEGKTLADKPPYKAINGYNIEGAREAAMAGKACMATRRTKKVKDGRPYVTEELVYKA